MGIEENKTVSEGGCENVEIGMEEYGNDQGRVRRGSGGVRVDKRRRGIRKESHRRVRKNMSD